MPEKIDLEPQIGDQEATLAEKQARITELQKIIADAQKEFETLQPDTIKLEDAIRKLRTKLKIATAEAVLSTQDFISFANSIPGISGVRAEQNRTYDHGPILSFEIENSASDKKEIGFLLFFPAEKRISSQLAKGNDLETFADLAKAVTEKLGDAEFSTSDDQRFCNWKNVDTSKLSQ